MTNRTSKLIIDLISVMKESEHPMTQAQIIEALMQKGYKRTTIVNIFYFSILQPIDDPDDEKIPMKPVIKKISSPYSAKSTFELVPEWGELDTKQLNSYLRHLD